MRTGVDRNTGAVLTGWDHCVQSILDIVSTAIGARVIARPYGSNAPNLTDRPQSPPSIVAHWSAIAEALRLWEAGFRLKQVSVTQLGPDGVAGFALGGDYYPDGHLGDYSVVVPMQTVVVPLPAIF
jgi:hypothetical protein